MTQVTVRAAQWRPMERRDAHELPLIVEFDDDRRIDCIAAISGRDLLTVDRLRDEYDYRDPFWTALGNLGAELARDYIEADEPLSGQMLRPNWQDAHHIARNDPGRYAPFEAGDVLLTFEQ